MKHDIAEANPLELYFTPLRSNASQAANIKSHLVLQILGRYATQQSMSRKSNCWDNAVAESFFSSLKKERVKKRIYKTREMARADMFDYIEMFYNRVRRHSANGWLSPEAFEQKYFKNLEGFVVHDTV
ncbi:IS1236 transposase protein 2 [Acinetobacter baumannii]|nr:IS1236 transposase protein 2 [Acinetobacter baumannii]